MTIHRGNARSFGFAHSTLALLVFIHERHRFVHLTCTRLRLFDLLPKMNALERVARNCKQNSESEIRQFVHSSVAFASARRIWSFLRKHDAATVTDGQPVRRAMSSLLHDYYWTVQPKVEAFVDDPSVRSTLARVVRILKSTSRPNQPGDTVDILFCIMSLTDAEFYSKVQTLIDEWRVAQRTSRPLFDMRPFASEFEKTSLGEDLCYELQRYDHSLEQAGIFLDSIAEN